MDFLKKIYFPRAHRQASSTKAVKTSGMWREVRET